MNPARHPALDAQDRAGIETVPVFTDDSLDEGGAQLCPCGIAMATPQHFTMASKTDNHTPTPEFPTRPMNGISQDPRSGRCAPHPAHIHQIRAGRALRDVNAGSSRTPLHHARRTHTIWQYWRVPALSGLLPPTPAPPGRPCQGCSHPPRHLPEQAALSFNTLLRQGAGAGLPPPLKPSAPHGARGSCPNPCPHCGTGRGVRCKSFRGAERGGGRRRRRTRRTRMGRCRLGGRSRAASNCRSWVDGERWPVDGGRHTRSRPPYRRGQHQSSPLPPSTRPV